MNFTARVLPISGIALLLTSTAALADVTAQQVWEDWQTSLQASGNITVTTASEDYAGGVLTVRDVTYTSEQDGAATRGNVPELIFTEQGDGSVSITMSAEQTMQISMVEDWGQGSFEANLVSEQPGLVATATGTPGAITYVVDAPAITIRLDQLLFDDEPVEAGGALVISDLAGSFDRVTRGELIDMSYTFTVSGVNLKGNLHEPDGDGLLQVSGNYHDLSGEGQVTLPVGFDSEDTAAMFAAGFAGQSSSQMGASETRFALDDDGENVRVALDLGSAATEATINAETLAYRIALHDAALDATGSDFPLPLALSADELSIGMGVPLSESAKPAPFSLGLSLAGVAVDNALWDMFDPGQQIARDPVTARVDISGTVTLTQDLLAMADEMEMMDGPPGMLNTLDINTIELSFGGASAHAEGSFAVDPAAAAAFDGFAMPAGSIVATMSGVNALLKQLGQAGLLPPEQAMGVTMMLGMFAVPAGDDQMTSTIEITPEGEIMANGMPLPF